MLAIRCPSKKHQLNRSITITKVKPGPQTSNWKGGQGRLSTELPSEIWTIQSALDGLGPTSWGCKSQENLLILQVPDGLSSEMMSDDLYLVPWAPGTLGNKRLHCLDNRNVNCRLCYLWEICIFKRNVCSWQPADSVVSVPYHFPQDSSLCLECDAELNVGISMSSRAGTVPELTVC